MMKQRKQLDVDLTEVIAQARAEERAAVVAWLRRTECAGQINPCDGCFARWMTAAEIERGEHRREEKP